MLRPGRIRKALLARTCLLAACSLATGAFAAGVAAQRMPLDLEEIVGRPHLVKTPDGALGGAAGYGIRFEPGGWEFGIAAAPGTLRYALEAVGRRAACGALESERVGDALPLVGEDTVRYVRRGFVERYELRREGVEQSFVFDTLPEGDGDLIVRGRLETDLPPSAPGADVRDLRFARLGGAGVAFGRVTGIDARGVRIEGAMRYEGGRLDLILPGSFVNAAVLPLVLDPLIGPTVTVPGGQDIDVAYDANTDRYLVVWSGTTYSPLATGYAAAQLVAPTGAFVGSQIWFASAYTLYSSGGRVRAAPAGNRPGFVVAYELLEHFAGPEVYVDYVDAATGLTVPRVTVGGASLQDIGASASGDAAVLVHSNSSLVATRLSINASGRLTLGGSRTLATASGGTLGPASISTNAGAEDRYLVVWDETRGPEQNLFSAFLDSNLNLLDGGAIGLFSTSKQAAAVDGDGTKWLVAYQTVSPASIGCFGVFWDPNSDSAYVTGDVTVAASGLDPAVAWTGESHLIVYQGGAWSVDPFTCLPCEGFLSLPAPAARHRLARSSRPSAGDLTMIASGRIASFFRADDGLITDLGGGCGRGGRAAATCAIVGNRGFAFRVRGALPFAPAVLVVGATPLALSCGPCTLVPNPASGIALGAGSTDRWGDAAVPVTLPAVPSLVGAQVLEQWLIVGGASCIANVDLSNALRVEIQ